MAFAAYINVEPTSGVSCSLIIDDSTRIAGTGQQHVEFHGIPDNVNGWGGYVEASAPGYKDARVRVQVVAPALLNPKPPEGDGGYVFVKLEKAAPDRITIDGRDFRQGGQRWVRKFCDYYRGLAELRDHGDGYFRDRLRYFKAFGFNGCRIYFAVNSFAQLHPLDDWTGHFARVRRACEIAAEEGMVFEWTGGDYQLVLPQFDHQLNAHNTMLDILRSFVSFYDYCNEAFKNGGIKEAIDRANRAGVLCTYGHPFLDPDHDGHTPALDYHAFGSSRSFPEYFVHQHKMWYYGEGIDNTGRRFDSPRPIIDQEPVGAAEFYEPGRRTNDPHVFLVQGKAAKAYGNGYTFHDDSFGSSWGPITESCARACIEGLTS